MISWHKVGQKIACIAKLWKVARGEAFPRPAFGEVVTIAEVGFDDVYGVFFTLEEYNPAAQFLPQDFRPVYPTIIDQIRNLDAPVPSDESELERVKEDA